MRLLSRYAIPFCACAFTAGPAWSQLPPIPVAVQLPTDDFVWTWGGTRPIDNVEEPEFSVSGIERSFRCIATGTFKPGSHMRDIYASRQFEQSLMGSITFIQTATAALNELYLSNDLQWALLECVIPETTEPEDEIQEDLDRALERAEREREQRRARAEREERKEREEE